MGNCCAATLSYLRNEHGSEGKSEYRRDKRELEKDRQKRILTAEEIKKIEEGKIDELVIYQKTKDAEKDAQLAMEEEKLRLEEQAYQTAKKAAAKKARQQQQHQRVQVEVESALTEPPTQPKETTSSDDKMSPSQQQLLHDEEDFDQFLENVKARSISLNKQGPDGPTNSSSVDKTEGEEEVDFGYWESAMLEGNPSTSKSPATSSTKDVDLDLL
ncbi:AP-1 complex-associated regulatory protein-like isoform X2 [Dysidea avara]|uniref:AP-1 complex-associated regulatory protein-like isoform X2 n=1 Tax=Dysidea avara TaxID=196820 RepID=UPI00331AD14A